MNIHNRQRTIYLARAGEAIIEHLYKADADLSSLGWEYSEQLCEFVARLRADRADESVERARAGFAPKTLSEPGSGPGEEGRILEVRSMLYVSCKAYGVFADLDISSATVVTYCFTIC